ncbi:MAG: DUF2752 domain-containing protein [Alistipes sp.]|nr:DUF2752 domain-containing protein [Alistipes sp.]
MDRSGGFRKGGATAFVRRHAAAAAVFAVVAVVALAAAYYFADPYSVWMPKCPFRLLTGFDCPACGSQRALQALVHGRVAEALGHNPFLVISIPYFLLVAYTTFWPQARERGLLRYVQHPTVIYLYAAVFILWWIFRNTPYWK